MYKEQIIKLYKEGKSYNEIVEKLGCAKSTVAYHCKKEGINIGKEAKFSEEDIIQMNEMYKTSYRKDVAKKFNVSEATVSYHCGTKRIKRTESKIKKDNVKWVTENRRKNKLKLVEYKGGKCQCCGYDRSVKALEFHHKNPEEKEFGLSTRGITKSFDRLKKEADKCVLVCANCHREIHEGLIKI